MECEKNTNEKSLRGSVTVGHVDPLTGSGVLPDNTYVSLEEGIHCYETVSDEVDLRDYVERRFYFLADKDIIKTLNAGAVIDAGSSMKASGKLIEKAFKLMQGNDSTFDVFAVVTPAFLSYLMGSEDEAFPLEYVHTKNGGYYKFNGITIIEYPNLPGAGTNAEKCFMYHRSAIGHVSEFSLYGDVNRKRMHSKFLIGSRIKDPLKIVVMNHDASGLFGI